MTQAAQMLHTSEFAVPAGSPLEQRAGTGHTLSPQSPAAVAATRVPTALLSILNMELPLPQQLQAAARIAVVPAILLSFRFMLPFSSVWWDEAEGIQSWRKK